MKTRERKKARLLRSKGWSLRAIASEVKCSKGVISKWISDIQLTDEQIKEFARETNRSEAGVRLLIMTSALNAEKRKEGGTKPRWFIHPSQVKKYKLPKTKAV